MVQLLDALMPVVLAGCSRHPSWACQQREVEGVGELAVASVAAGPGRTAKTGQERAHQAIVSLRSRVIESPTRLAAEAVDCMGLAWPPLGLSEPV